MRILSLGFLICLTFVLTSCDPYEKILRSNNFEQKLKYAKELYNTEQYERCTPLLEEVIAYYKGTKDVSDYYYYYAWCYYGMEEYLQASFYFKQFYNSYPQNTKSEDAMYWAAYCYYLLTPKPSLDQSFTNEAIEMLQNFLVTYPTTPRFDQTKNLIVNLRNKLETKAIEAAQMYFRTENYKAATTAFENILIDFPDTKNKEEIRFYIFKSKYNTAINSISSKKLDRLNTTKADYLKFIDQYPNSAYLREAEKLYNQTLLQIQKIKST